MMRISKGTLVRVAIAGTSLALTLVAMEVAARWIGLSKTYQAYRTPENLRYREIMRVNPPESPLSFDLMPGRDVLVKGVPMRISGQGLREDREFTADKPPGLIRIVCLGDSVTFGMDIPVEDTYPKQLERLYVGEARKVEVMNFAVPGYNLAQNLEMYYERAARFRPDVVVLQFVLNDIPGPRRAATTAARNRPVSWGRRLSEAGKNVLRESALYLFAAERVNFLFLRYGQRLPIIDAYRVTPEDWRTIEELLRPFAGRVRADGATLVFVFFPYEFQIVSPLPEVHEATAPLRALVEGLGVRFVDLTAVIKGLYARARATYLDDSHLTAESHQAVAQTLKRLIDGAVIPGAAAMSPGRGR
jgi:lysophospholipase L1-like esterase